jgi:site-specific DNA-methyltransferase (adenine-specific)
MGDEYEPTGQIDYAKGRMFSSEIKNDNTQLNITNAWEGWGTALKPANEPICLARKPLSEKSVAENVLKHGTGGINIDGCRVGSELIKGQKAGQGFNDVKGFGVNTKLGNEQAKEYISNDIIGRFPANVIHDGSEEVLQGFPHTGNGNGGKPYNYSGKEYDNKETSMFNGDKPQAPSNFNDSGSASRFFYCAKASKSDRSDGNNHPTVKPTELMRYLCRLITPPNGIVLDPFMGSGSTGKGAILEGFDFIGMELDPEYVEIAKSRIEYAQKEYKQNLSQQKLF